LLAEKKEESRGTRIYFPREVKSKLQQMARDNRRSLSNQMLCLVENANELEDVNRANQ
jgi:hypothetical protein